MILPRLARRIRCLPSPSWSRDKKGRRSCGDETPAMSAAVAPPFPGGDGDDMAPDLDRDRFVFLAPERGKRRQS